MYFVVFLSDYIAYKLFHPFQGSYSKESAEDKTKFKIRNYEVKAKGCSSLRYQWSTTKGHVEVEPFQTILQLYHRWCSFYSWREESEN